MLEPASPWSDLFNTGVDYFMGAAGYDVSRRGVQGDGDATGGAVGDNSFYRDNADWLPGWGNSFGLDFLDPHGVPSGATCHDRATNHVGIYDPSMSATDNQIWTDVRTDLVTNEAAAIAAAQARGDTSIGFGDVYDAHVDAYASAQAAALASDPTSDAANGFIDPASMVLAVYGAPLIEQFGIDSGPIVGASIDLTNDPTDTAADGWAKRMALSGVEIGAGGALLGGAVGAAATGHMGLAAMSGLAGLGAIGLGAFSGAWNTATAIGNGMGAADAVGGLANVAGSMAAFGGTVLGDAAGAVGGAFV
jgi:hypothetical protein